MTPDNTFNVKSILINPARDEAISLLLNKIFAQPLKLGVVSSEIVVEVIPVMPITGSLWSLLVRQVHQ